MAPCIEANTKTASRTDKKDKETLRMSMEIGMKAVIKTASTTDMGK